MGATLPPVAERLAALPWADLERSLWDTGLAVTDKPVLTDLECEALSRLYASAARFRSRIDMARFRFGIGEYQYFAYPLPDLVADLRTHAYPHLVRVANGWAEALGADERYPSTHDALLARCRDAGQTRPTPLLLRYEAGGYNCLHQDLYGEVVFPLQMLVSLSAPRVDYRGGEFLLVEQRPRAQSVATVAAGPQGAAAFFTTRHRPVRGARGYYRANVRHGVSRVLEGTRYTLGVIFHDAK
jgi:hypothetical protein